MVLLSSLLVIGAAISLILLVGLQNRVNTAVANYHNAISRADQGPQTPQQQQAIASANAQIKTEQKQEGKAIDLSYAVEGTSLVVGIAVVTYLTRPGVKAAFHVLQM